MIRRRTAFAAPLVIVSCAAPPAPHRETVRFYNDPSPPEPWHAPEQYVSALEPLSRTQPCNPPPPAELAPENWPAGCRSLVPVHHGPPQAGQWLVDNLAPDGTGTRIRLMNEDDRVDARWRISIVDPDGHRLDTCRLVERDHAHVDCRTALTPRQVAPHGIVYGVLVEPP